MLAKETTSPIKSIGDSYGYSLQELRAASMANVQLDSTKGSAARRMIEEQIDKLLSFGSVPHGFRGLLNQTGTSTYVIRTVSRVSRSGRRRPATRSSTT